MARAMKPASRKMSAPALTLTEKDADEATNDMLLKQHQKPMNTLRRALPKGRKASKYGTARYSGVAYNQADEDITIVKACIRDTRDLMRNQKLEELIGKGVTHLIIEDDDHLLKSIPEGITKIVTLRSFTLTWSKVKLLPNYFLRLDLKELSIRKCPLKSIDGIHFMHELVALELESDGLKTVPVEIGGMVNLQHLSLNGNSLKALPNSLGNLNQLHTLKVCGNSLSTLPMTIAGLTQLETLDASQNRIKVIPDATGSLHNLITLRLSHNQISVLPNSFRELTNLRHLYLGSNRFSETPLVLAHLSDLQTLNLVSNRVSNISSALPNLLTLLLDKNLLEDLPGTLFGFVKLQKLAIQHNNLKSISPNIARLSSLRALYLGGNNLTELPDEICLLDDLRHLVMRETEIQELPTNFDSLTHLSMIDIENTKLDYQYTYALRQSGIQGLMEVVQTKRSSQSETTNMSNRPISGSDDDRGSSIFDEQDSDAEQSIADEYSAPLRSQIMDEDIPTERRTRRSEVKTMLPDEFQMIELSNRESSSVPDSNDEISYDEIPDNDTSQIDVIDTNLMRRSAASDSSSNKGTTARRDIKTLVPDTWHSEGFEPLAQPDHVWHEENGFITPSQPPAESMEVVTKEPEISPPQQSQTDTRNPRVMSAINCLDKVLEGEGPSEVDEASSDMTVESSPRPISVFTNKPPVSLKPSNLRPGSITKPPTPTKPKVADIPRNGPPKPAPKPSSMRCVSQKM